MAETTYNGNAFQLTRPGWLTRRLPLGLTISTAALAGIMVLALFIHFYNLSAIHWGNLYYTAGVASMIQSWKNFFFVAAEPGGSVTIDKPPLGLWIQAVSAFFFGVNGFAVVLPQIIAGLLSIPLLYWLVKRTFGEMAGLIAALVLAITPIFAATNRNNTMDTTLVFTLLLAAWAFMKAADSGRLRWLLAGALLVGLGFNIKMMQAFLPLPAFYGLYLLGSREGWLRKILNLAAATVLLMAVSLSWALIVDAVPASQRPYIGSSTDNTVMELIVGHNGLNRLFGPGALSGRNNGPQGQPPTGGPQNGPQFGPPPQIGQGVPPNGQPKGPGGPGGPGGEVGLPGMLRLFTAPLSNEAAWFLPFSLIAIGIVAAGTRFQLPLAPAHRGLMLWGGWLVTCVVFFSVASFFHAYYMIMLAPAAAALVGMGIARLWELYETRPVPAVSLLIVLLAVALISEFVVAYQYVQSMWWFVPTAVIAGASAALLASATAMREPLAAKIGASGFIAAILITPLIWTILTVSEKSPDVALPNAYDGQPLRQGNGPIADLNVDRSLLTYLEQNTQGTTYLFAVPSAMQGASYVLATGRPVLYMGGFGGGDQVVTAQDLQRLVADGELRYILWQGSGPGRDRQSISQWLQQSCRSVRQTQDGPGGPPPGNGPGNGPNGPQPGRPQQQSATLYQCGV